MLLIVAPISSAAQIDFSLIDRVNTAVSELDYLHFKTRYYSKPYYTDDTTIIDAETWVYKTKDDTILGMHIRSVGHLDYGHIETIHRGTDSWIIKHDADTIEKYDQTNLQDIVNSLLEISEDRGSKDDKSICLAFIEKMNES